ncbi:MAG TPA: GatB/YqeY domain-containing protein [Gemmatirosa sp.]|nr:GatB/YqeY domain-containing protein [Gemmatirosa sp.]
MSALHDRLQADLNTARKAQDKPLTLVLGTLLSEIKNKRIELRRDLVDDEVVDVVRKAGKRRRESVEMYEKGGRLDLMEKEQAELVILERYLPPAVDPEELRAAVRAAIAGGATTMGAVMGKVMPQFRGRVEGGAINALAKEELAAAQG